MDIPLDGSLAALVQRCAPQVHVQTVFAIVAVESNFNPWAIGVVGGRLERQPTDRRQALATAHKLQREGWNFSIGLGQINVRNFERLGLTLGSAFDSCTNLHALQVILIDCMQRLDRAGTSQPWPAPAVHHALSCYYSGDFVTGFQHGYVQKVLSAARSVVPTLIHKERP